MLIHTLKAQSSKTTECNALEVVSHSESDRNLVGKRNQTIEMHRDTQEMM